MSINNTIALILLLLLSLATPVMTPQLGSYDPLSPSLSPSSPPADAPFAENVKSEEREESGSGGIVAGVVAALCVIVLGHLVGVLHNNHPVIQLNLQGNMPDNPPEILLALRNIRNVNSCFGLRCSSGVNLITNIMSAIIWHPANPAVVPVEIDVTPNQGYTPPVLGFGGPPGDPKLLKIDVQEDSDGRPIMWRVDVISLSTDKRLNVDTATGAPFESCRMECSKFCENGKVIYFRSYTLSDTGYLKDRSNFFISFDLETMRFGKVPLPRSLVNTTRFIHAAKVNGKLGLLEYRDGVYDVWAKRWGANDTSFWRICNYFGVYETFTKIGTIDVGGQLYGGYGAPVPEVELDVGIGGYLWWLLI